METIIEILSGGELRSIGRANEVAEMVATHPERFAELFVAISNQDPRVRMRAADAAEKVTDSQPQLLAPFKIKLLNEVATINQQEVRWHVAQMLPRLPFTNQEAQSAFSILSGYLDDKSAIVRTFSLQALTDLALTYPQLREQVTHLIRAGLQSKSKAVSTRCKKLIMTLEKVQKK
ncbi:MAG TPA: hypothetical protein G4N92_02650 [Anaerolineae bacterium]|nr:hypothetical protein [Anaerolineae bacterium]